LHGFTYVPLALPFAVGWLSLIAPILILYLLFAVTGIPYTEKRALASRGDTYRDYQRRTNAFFPWFKKDI
jgi:steroid 5-alpha reductase family enzyme